MNLIKAIVLSEKGGDPTNAQEVVNALSHALVGKKITAFGPKGKGLWGEHPEVQSYRIKKVVGHLMKDEHENYGNIDIYLDGYSAHGSKVKDKYGHTAIVGGLIYTDKTFITHLKQLLAGVHAMEFVKSLGYSEQGMQGNNYVNLDIEFKKFPKKVTEAIFTMRSKITKDEVQFCKDNGIKVVKEPETSHSELHGSHDALQKFKDEFFAVGEIKEGKEEPHIHAHKVGDDIEWDEEEGDAENGPTGHLNLASGTVTKLHPKGYMVKRHDSFSGDDKDQLIHHNWARKMEPRGEDDHDRYLTGREEAQRNEGAGDYDIHVKKVPSGTFGQLKITREIVHTKHPELKKRYGTKGDGLTTDMVNRMKARGYKVKEDDGAYEGEYRLVEAKKKLPALRPDKGDAANRNIDSARAKKDPSSVILDIAVQGGDHEMGTDADTIKWAKKYNCTAKKLHARGPGGGWPEWKFTGDPKDIRRLVTNYCGDQKSEIEYLLGHEDVNEATNTTPKKVGDRIKVKAHKVLGTPAAMGTIRKVKKNHYIVHIDGDGEEWDGPVSFDGEVLAEALTENVDAVYSRLLNIAKDVNDISKSEEQMTKRDIKQMQATGWTDDEIVSCLRNMEHINPDIEEDKALKRMADVKKKVEHRLKVKGD
jgi:hypothetical protein